MALFSKRKIDPKDLPVIGIYESSQLAGYARDVWLSGLAAKGVVQSIPGLQDYIVTSLVPRLASAGMLGDISKCIGILASDAVLGATIASIARTIKDLNAK